MAVKSATVDSSQKLCEASPVGAAGAVTVTVIITVSLQVTPFEVTSTQYSVVCIGVTEMDSVVSPVDQITDS